MKLETSVHYVPLSNTRCDAGSSYRAIEKLFKELGYGSFPTVSFMTRDNIMGIYNRSAEQGEFVYIYDYKRSMMPVCVVCRDEGEIKVHIKTTELWGIDDVVITVKSMMNALVIKG